VSENIILGTPASLSQQLKPSNCSCLSNDRYHMAERQASGAGLSAAT